MKSISPEKKLELVRRIREESHQNQSLMTGRESILNPSEPEGIIRHPRSGKARIMLAVLLFLFCLWTKYTGGLELMQYEDLRLALRQEIDLNAIDFIEDLPYTLTNADAAVEIGTMRIEEGH